MPSPAVRSIGTGAALTGRSGGPVTPPPAAPTDLAATAGNASVILNWTKSDGATSYKIYRDDVLIDTVGDVATYTDSGLPQDIEYFYFIKASNTAGDSDATSQVSATPPSAPPTPDNFAITPDDTVAHLSWDAAARATSYQVYNAADDSLRDTMSGTTYDATGLTNGVSYGFYVKAVNVGGSSAATATVNVTPAVPVPENPVRTCLVVELIASDYVGSDGDAVATWLNTGSIGSSGDGTQLDSAKRLIFKTGIINGKAVMRADGVDDRLDIAASTTSPETTIFAVFQKRSAPGASSQAVLQLEPPSNNDLFTNSTFGTGFNWYANGAGAVDSFGGVPTDVAVLAMRWMDATHCEIYHNDPVTPFHTFLSNGGHFATGAMSFGGIDSGVNGDFDFAHILRYSAALSPSDITAVMDYLTGLYLP